MKNILYFLNLIWSTGFNLIFRILPSFFYSVASATQISAISSAYSSTRFFAVPCGLAADRIGKVKVLVYSFLAICFVASAFLLSNSIIFFSVMFFLVGIIANFYYSSINALVTIFFKKKKTESLFKLEVFYQIGSTIGPILGGILTAHLGLNFAIYTWVGLSLIGAILSSSFSKNHAAKPKEDAKKATLKDFLHQLKQRKFAFLVFFVTGSFLTGFFQAIINLAMPLYGSGIGFDIARVGEIIGIGSFLSVFGLFFLGKKLEKIDKSSAMILMMSLILFSTIGTILTHNLIFLGVFLGIFTTGRAGGLNIARAFLSENLEENIRATGMSLNDTFYYIAMTVGPIFAGILIDKINIETPFIFISAMAFLGMILLTAYKIMRWSLRPKSLAKV